MIKRIGIVLGIGILVAACSGGSGGMVTLDRAVDSGPTVTITPIPRPPTPSPSPPGSPIPGYGPADDARESFVNCSYGTQGAVIVSPYLIGPSGPADLDPQPYLEGVISYNSVTPFGDDSLLIEYTCLQPGEFRQSLNLGNAVGFLNVVVTAAPSDFALINPQLIRCNVGQTILASVVGSLSTPIEIAPVEPSDIVEIVSTTQEGPSVLLVEIICSSRGVFFQRFDRVGSDESAILSIVVGDFPPPTPLCTPFVDANGQALPCG